MTADAGTALVVVDVQRDFLPGGRLAVPDGDAVVPVINRLLAGMAGAVFTQDWHPAGHASFASSHAGKLAFETVRLSYGEQVLWPDHCLIGSAGAGFADGLAVAAGALVIRKGFRREIDSYSGFRENDRQTPTGLHGYLSERGVRRLVLAGLARDYCVHYTALDALALGYEVAVVEDACRAIDAAAAVAAREALVARGGRSVSAESVLTGG